MFDAAGVFFGKFLPCTQLHKRFCERLVPFVYSFRLLPSRIGEGEVARVTVYMDVPLLFKQVYPARHTRFNVAEFVSHIHCAHIRLTLMQQQNGLQIHFLRFPRPFDSHRAQPPSYVIYY